MKTLTYHQRIVNLLRDKGRGWTPFKEIHKAVSRHIDADAADKEYRKRHPNWKDDAVEDRVKGGKRRLVILSLITLNHHRKMLEVKGDEASTKQYRLTAEALKKQRTKADKATKGKKLARV